MAWLRGALVVVILTRLVDSRVIHPHEVAPDLAVAKRRSDAEDSFPRLRRTPVMETTTNYLRYLQKEDKTKDDDETETMAPTEVPTLSPLTMSPLSGKSLYPPRDDALVPKVDDEETELSSNGANLPSDVETTRATTSPSTSPTTAEPSIAPITSQPATTPTTRSPTQQPTSLAPTIAPSLAPTPIKEYVFLHVFDIRMQFDTTVDPSLLIVWNDRIRAATEAYLLQTLPFHTIESVQLYAVEQRRRLKEQQHTFRYGGVAVFRGNTPNQTELQLQQRLVIGKTLELQEWFRQKYSIFEANVLLAGFASDDTTTPKQQETAEDDDTKKKTWNPFMPEEELSTLLIAGAAGAVLVILLLLCCVVCRVCRRRKDVTVDAFQKFHPNDRTLSTAEDGEELTPPRGKSCMMQIVDLDHRAKPLILPRKLLCALPNVNDAESSVSGFSLGSHLQVSPSPTFLPTNLLSSHTEDEEPSQQKRVLTSADLRGKHRAPSWLRGDDAESSIHASDTSASQFSISDKFQDTNPSQCQSSSSMLDPERKVNHNTSELDTELVQTLHDREDGGHALVDDAWELPAQQQQNKRQDDDGGHVPFDESVVHDEDDNFDSMASKLEEEIARIKHEIVGRQRTANDSDDTEMADNKVLKWCSVRVHR